MPKAHGEAMTPKVEKGDWAVIRKYGITSLVCFKNETDYYWGQSSVWACVTVETEVVEVLGKIPLKDWDRMELAYIKKYYPAAEGKIAQSAGWISPTGKWFTCSPHGHDGLARDLSVHFYDDLESPVYRLETEGWLRVYVSGDIATPWRKGPVAEVGTDDQFLMIAKLSQAGTWGDRLRSHLPHE